ncbi:mercuric reductase [Caldisphaera lagunensis DSM 15908]|uniref:Mercuric reductase n=1 Tax=Caldisphaera lagunensis (strain DSM 15908 / JCM 11604 / ANMR 0165 / IC-154) TaxID=1056495 RepID=L0AB50_CALLD|nr:mercury(II) reductase [Caldisphaera lagunensis]AFZ70372.1 mercuric reductase [Caldisphaera lagunensis DSM 15908]
MKDLVIIGYGAAGFAALIKANELNVKPVLIGEGPIGGTCVNVGCVPSKKLLSIGEIYYKSRKHLKLNIYPPFFETFKEKDNLVSNLRKMKYEDVISSSDVELIEGKAKFISPHEVKVGNKIIEGKKFIIATGSSPKIPRIPGLDKIGYWTNNEALSPDRKIDSLAIIGGGPLGLEFAQMYKRLGVDVIVLEALPVLLYGWEPEISLEAEKILENEGISVVTNVNIKEIKKGSGKVIVTNKGEVEVDEILVATGRKPNTDLDLEKANVDLNENKGIKVDEELRTSNKDIYAAGDVIGSKMLEALAGKQGTVAAENALLDSHKKIDMLSVPQVVFLQPNIASVGLTEAEAEKIYRIETSKIMMEDLPKANILGENEGFIKMIIEEETKKILGVHLVSENGAEIINEASLAIKMRANINDLIDTIHVFPTMGEAIRLAALSFISDIKKMSCCV